jgi:hypothetical protein
VFSAPITGAATTTTKLAAPTSSVAPPVVITPTVTSTVRPTVWTIYVTFAEPHGYRTVQQVRVTHTPLAS